MDKVRIAAMFACVAVLGIGPARADSDSDTLQKLLALERQAMDGWQKGDPGPQMAICDADITYIHDVVGVRLDGLAAVKQLFDSYRGVPLFQGYEILTPKVQSAGDVAVLTYQLVQRNGDIVRHWNGTQVYRKKAEGWRVIHTHWSAAKD